MGVLVWDMSMIVGVRNRMVRARVSTNILCALESRSQLSGWLLIGVLFGAQRLDEWHGRRKCMIVIAF